MKQVTQHMSAALDKLHWYFVFLINQAWTRSATSVTELIAPEPRF